MDEGHHEIVIIRRGGHGDHDEHHGGVWKIAFADFMTAMMAFFLVLWLISANDKTRASVARYFNPVRLVDATTQPRGLHDSKKDDSGITASPDTKDKKSDAKVVNDAKPKSDETETPKGREKRLDAELRDNPYVALAEIVGDKGPGDPRSKGDPAPTPAIGRGGSAFRDPFAPPPPSADPDVDAKTAQDITDLLPPRAEEVHADAPAPSTTPPKAAPQDDQDRVDALRAELAATLRNQPSDTNGPALEVRKTDEGTLVSLTDTANYTMFANGSAVPDKRIVEMMAKIAPLLKERPGTIVIRGFTDNKKFHGGRYDNWHLSLDRAQVAHYMLVRGGLADMRVSHVEGYADHAGKSGLDAGDPRNRRIEILVKDVPA